MPTARPPARADADPLPGNSLRVGLSITVALAVNAGALLVAAAEMGSWRASPQPPVRTPWITTVALADPLPLRSLPMQNPPPRARDAPPALSTSPAPSHPRQGADNAPPADRMTEAPVDMNLSDTATSAQPIGSLDTRYYAYAEVDRAAEPDADWNLDPAIFDSNGLQTLTFDIFIGRDGEVTGCTVLTPADMPEPLRRLIEDRLRQATIQPAIRGGAAVASVRRIELSVAPPAP